jgi:pyridoxamine 5'-phosphate oxidase
MSTLDFDHPPREPLEMAKAWLEHATASTGLPNPNAMTLATVDPDGGPSARIVLLRGLDEHGALFFTNYRSRKGRALAAHPRAALVLHWDVLERQIRIEGSVTQASREESDGYWASRGRDSRIGAWASQQSEPLESREALVQANADFAARFDGQEVPRPEHWGGFRVALEHVEFWEGKPARVHDRIVYTADAEGWMIKRLSP